MAMMIAAGRTVGAAALVAGLALSGCGWGHPPRRPETVPPGATPVAFSKEGGWAYCWMDPAINLNRCRTYNTAGERLYRFGREHDEDDVFLPDEGTGPVPEEQLKVDIIHTSPAHIWLENGVVLLPRNDFENQKRWTDSVKAVRRELNEKKGQFR